MGAARRERRQGLSRVHKATPVPLQLILKDGNTLSKMSPYRPEITLDPHVYVKTQQSVYERLAMFAGVSSRTRKFYANKPSVRETRHATILTDLLE